jgi:hypothetical protein
MSYFIEIQSIICNFGLLAIMTDSGCQSIRPLRPIPPHSAIQPSVVYTGRLVSYISPTTNHIAASVRTRPLPIPIPIPNCNLCTEHYIMDKQASEASSSPLKPDNGSCVSSSDCLLDRASSVTGVVSSWLENDQDLTETMRHEDYEVNHNDIPVLFYNVSVQ